MPFYRCTICEENGKPVAENVTVVIEHTGSGQEASWYGTIMASHSEPLTAGQRYRLTLEDGRTGSFHVRRITSAGETERVVAINGTGPLG